MKNWKDTSLLAQHWHKLDNGKIECDLCPRHCKTGPGQMGFCKVRGNVNGEFHTFNYGKSVAATEEARELGINVSVGDGNENGKDSIEWVRGSKSFHVLRNKDSKLTIRRVFGAGKGETMARDSDPPSEAELSAWVQNVAEEGADFLSDELQPALHPKKS